MNIQIESIIKNLQKERPIFHSEADFQHALAREIQRHHPSAAVRLEINQGIASQREYIDILVKEGASTYAIELKYKTKELDIAYKDEEFHLLNQGAYDIGRYDFIKDVVRLERFVESRPNSAGYAIFLTNDDLYWRETKRLTTFDAMFHIHESRVLNGELRWSEATGAGTMKGRENPLVLRGAHPIQWVDYSESDGDGPRKFRYVLLGVRNAIP
jgi:hypothetical protein